MLAVPFAVSGGFVQASSALDAWLTPSVTRVFDTRVPGEVRPARGYDSARAVPTPLPTALPKLEPAVVPTAAPVVAAPPPPSAAAGSLWQTGVVRTGQGVQVRKAVNLTTPSDPVLPDGSAVLLSPNGVIRVGAETWRSVRGLNGIVGWIPESSVVLDGTAQPGTGSITVAGASATPSARTASPATAPPSTMRVVRTDGVGVVLRSSPEPNARMPRGLLEGTQVTVLERSGADWVRVQAANGQEGWVPAQYLDPA